MHVLRPALLLMTALLSGCSTLGYYSQAIGGQLDILARTRPISELLADTPADDPQATAAPLAPELKARLATVLKVRAFATEALALPDNGSYSVYADLGRPMVAWNVIATPEFSLTPREWCYPFAGCVPYRGYFARARAERFAAELRRERLDVRVAGVAAYSTLGWFRDPVLNTHLRHDDAELAALIFHELAHQIVYVPGDAVFNESFATTVEIEGLRRWLVAHGDPAAFESHHAARRRHAEFVALVLDTRAQLVAVYAAPDGDEAKRAAKRRQFEALRADYAHLKERWGGDDRYDHWFAQDLNNAHLVTVGLYHQHVPAFQALLAEVHEDLPAFYRAVRALSRLSESARQSRLAALGATRLSQGD
jgi:predicted aminopeptidase